MFIPIGTDAPLRYWPIATGLLIFANILCFIVQHQNSDYLSSNDAMVREGDHVSASLLQDFNDLNLDDIKQDDDPEWDTGEVDLDDWDDFEGDDAFEKLLREKIAAAIGGHKQGGWRRHALWVGDGLHPTQWVTSFFMHLNLSHLLGNLFFLGLFGVIVEGRMGSWQFALYYLTVGITGSIITQVLLLGADETICLGASGAIYGIMVTASLWSPRVNVICLFLFWFQAFFPRIPLLIFVAAYVLIDFGSVLFTERLVNTPMLHVLGAIAGAIVSIIVLRMHWVDTEHQDVISMLIEVAGKDPKKVNKRPLTKKEVEQKETEEQTRRITREEKLERIWRSVDAHLAANNLDAAIEMGRTGVQMAPSSGWSEPRLLRLIGKLQVAKLWKEVIQFSKLYLEKYSEREVAIRINLAKIFVIQKRLPRRALKTIKPLSSKPLTAAQATTVRKIVSEAQKQIDDGVLEIGD